MRGRELREGIMQLCCCSCRLCLCSFLVVKYLAQPKTVPRLDVGGVSLVGAAELWQSFAYGMSGAVGQCLHKYPALLGKHHIRKGQPQQWCASSVSSKGSEKSQGKPFLSC